MRNRIKFWTDREIRAAFDKRGGKYKGILQQLMMERDYAYKRQIATLSMKTLISSCAGYLSTFFFGSSKLILQHKI